MNEELMIQLPTNPIEVFKQEAMTAIIDRVKAIVKDSPKDTTTAKGRKEIASMAFSIARTKAAIDEVGKNLVEPMKAQAKLIDAERKRARDELDALKDSVRKPLTDWETAEEARQTAIRSAITRITVIGETAYDTVEKVDAAIVQFSNALSADFGDHKAEATQIIELTQLRLEKQRTALFDASVKAQEQKRIAEESAKKAEAERMEREAKERKEREERIASEAAERARLAAEAKAEAARVSEAAKAERERAEREREAQRKIDEERNRNEELVRSAERAKIAAENAARIERERIEAERKADIDARAKREADKEHREQFIREASIALSQEPGVITPSGRAAIDAIVAGRVPHVTFNF